MDIKSLFAQDAKLLNELVFLLSREQVSLINADIDAMEAILDEKGVLLQTISASAQNRYKVLFKAGFEPSENGMVAWVEKNAQLQSWHDFQKTLEQAKEMNRLNGQLINKHFNRNQQLLNHLQGKSNSDGMYGANGQATSNSYSRATLSV